MIKTLRKFFVNKASAPVLMKFELNSPYSTFKYLDKYSHVITSLNKDLNILLKDFIKNDEINPNSIILKNLKNIKNLEDSNLRKEEIAILKEFYYLNTLKEHNEGFFKLFIDSIGDSYIEINNKTYSFEELSELIATHNKSIIVPKINEYLPEKKMFLDHFDYNTPKLEDTMITPMVGTSCPDAIYGYCTDVYRSWIISSYALLAEYNIWYKVKLYLDNINSKDCKFNSSIYKEAYYYYIARQFYIANPFDYFEAKNRAHDFTKHDILLREISEDLFYILLNLLLADKIIGNKDLEKSLSLKDENLFFSLLGDIIKDHYDKNKEGYKCLYDLKWSRVNSLGVNQFKNLRDNKTK
jgi:hypothetical protein